MKIVDRISHAWDAFKGSEPLQNKYDIGPAISHKSDRRIFTITNEQTIMASIISRIANDVASVNIVHCKLDKDGRYLEDVKSGLNECLTTSANIDQTGREFIRDVTASMLDEGVVAIVPIDTSTSPINYNSYDIYSMRVGQIITWYPEHVMVKVYNEKTGFKEDIVLPKSMVAIVENPFYAVMNEPNSTLSRLKTKLQLLDQMDNQISSGKLDLIFQLPYTINAPAKEERAEKRRKSIEMQLTGSKYGIAYIDATEKVTQLNRPVENTMLSQIEYLTRMLYSQLGMSEGVFNGTASEQEQLTYYTGTVDVILTAITESMRRTFLTKTARTQGQTIKYFRDPFRLVPTTQLAEISDKFTRNEIISSNEVRSIIGLKPDKNPRSDELLNKNIRVPEETSKVVEKTKVEERETNEE